MATIILGSVIGMAMAVVGACWDAKKGWGKATIILFAFVGVALTSWSARKQDQAQERSERDAFEARARLADLQKHTLFISATIGDLGKLNELSGGRKYYVRIAADASRGNLLPYLKNIYSQFKGAETSRLVIITEPRPPSRNYELVFGLGLEFAAAEVFQRLAMSHRLVPPGQVAQILPE